MLVLAPTRELAKQIDDECSMFAKSSRIAHTVVFGGVPRCKFDLFSAQSTAFPHLLLDLGIATQSGALRSGWVCVAKANDHSLSAQCAVGTAAQLPWALGPSD